MAYVWLVLLALYFAGLVAIVVLFLQYAHEVSLQLSRQQKALAVVRIILWPVTIIRGLWSGL